MDGTYSPKNADLNIAASVADRTTGDSLDHFVLTGSYSLELLTGSELKHNDIDANIFTENVKHSVGRIALLFEDDKRFTNTLINDSRLEYRYDAFGRIGDLELQFHQYRDAIENDGTVNFILPSHQDGREVIVPTIMTTADIGLRYEDEYLFRLKTLEFAIATWALRITGFASHQKRSVRQSDVDHFIHLMRTPYDTDEVIFSLEHHPQMPQSCESQRVLDEAFALFANKVKDND